jgi:hypothetical protein
VLALEPVLELEHGLGPELEHAPVLEHGLGPEPALVLALAPGLEHARADCPGGDEDDGRLLRKVRMLPERYYLLLVLEADDPLWTYVKDRQHLEKSYRDENAGAGDLVHRSCVPMVH